MSRTLLLRTALALLLLLTTATLTAPDVGKAGRQNYHLEASVIAAGGSVGQSPQFNLTATLGQAQPVGRGSSTNFGFNAGFWAGFGEAPATGVDLPVPLENVLHPNYPNPFNPSTTISYGVGDPGPVTLAVYNLKGERVRSLVQEMTVPGTYQVVWDGKDDGGSTVATGTYFCRLEVGQYTSVKKMLLLK